MNDRRASLMIYGRRSGSSRRGITILEVLIAAGVLAIGMFGVMAMIPLIAMRLREGEIADRSAILSRNAVEEFQVRGWTEPRRWRWYRADGAYVDPTTTTFPAPPQLSLRALDWSDWNTAALRANLPATPAICIDPQGVTGIDGANTLRRQFPYTTLNARYAMQRVTPFPLTNSAAPNNLTDKGIAEVGAVAEDDLLFERPESRTDLPFQTFPVDRGVATTADQQTRRMAQRDYSYMATLTPMDDVTVFNGRGNYLLSAIVFYQRSRTYEDEFIGSIDNNSAGGYGFRSSGVSGGDVAIDCSAMTGMPLLDVTKGDWVMLTYPAQVNGSGVVIRPAVHRWYQVIEAAPYDSVLEPNYRFVTLAGPDWPYIDNPSTAAVEWADDTQVTWLPGVASVSEKTVTLGSDGTWE